MKTTKISTLLVTATIAAPLGAFYGIIQVSHGHPMPVANGGSLLTMPVIAGLLAVVAYPIYRYRKQLAVFAKADSGKRPERPKRVDPFYAVRVLLLAKSTAIAASALGGFQLGLVALQLSTPVVSSSLWFNLGAALGDILAVVVAMIVERICRTPDSGTDESTSEAAA